MQSGRFSRIGTPAATMSSSRPGNSDVELLRAARHQKVYVTILRNRGAVHRFGRQIVALVHRHAVEEVRQHPRGTQPTEAGADDDRVFPSLR